MTENEAIKDIKENVLPSVGGKSLEMAIQALEEIQSYRAMEQRLQNIYGECDGLLEKVVSHLENHENIELPDHIIKARLLTDEDVDKWEAYKAIGTVEECKAAVERMKPEKPYIQQDEKDNDCLECPNCDSFIGYAVDCVDEQYRPDYCLNCGQAIDWSE